MKLIQILNIKNKPLMYIFLNIFSILLFTILYYLADYYTINNFNNPWYYWLYFSSITQTTIGYSGLRIKNKNINFTTVDSSSVQVLLFLQILSIILINGYILI